LHTLPETRECAPNGGYNRRSEETPEEHIMQFPALIGICCTLLFAAPAAADTYPSRGITLILPFAAGSGTDTTTRLIAQQLSTALGQSVVIDNKAGANGMIAANAAARAAPDGYTLFVTTNTTHSANPSLLKSINYDPVKDFTPIARTGNLPFILVVHPDVPAKSVQELIAHAKANPGKLTYASGNSTGIVAGATFAKRAGIELLHVPYKSTPPAMNDVLGGRVSMIFIDLTSGLSHVEAKALRALAVTTKERSALLPDLPSMQEAGVPDFDITSWQGYFGPAKLPKEIVARLNGEIRKVIANPDVKAKLAALGFDAFSGPPEELGKFVDEQLANWSRMVKDAGIEPQ
jgi:tripartite-type tricarboxylate transporter receptor subunit TctC